MIPSSGSYSEHQVRASLEACHQLVRQASSSFVPAFRSLPSAKYQAMMVLYAFMRHTDDIVDKPLPSVSANAVANAEESLIDESAVRFAELKKWRAAVKAVVGEPDDTMYSYPKLVDVKAMFSDVPNVEILPAVRYITEQFGIPKSVYFEAISGVEMDIVPCRFQTFEESAAYCHAVATSVGIASLAIWGTKEPLCSPQVVEAAKACGIAFQCTNFLRDISEDFVQGRFYFPMKDLHEAGWTEKQLMENMKDLEKLKKLPRWFDDFMEVQLNRCATYYTLAVPLYDLIQPDSRVAFGKMFTVYHCLFRKIQKNPPAVLSKRVKLGLLEKIFLVLRWNLWPPRHLGTV